MIHGPSITILFLHIYLNYTSKTLEQLIYTLINLSKSVHLKNAQTLAANENSSIWKRFPSFCKVVVSVLLLISCLENIAYSFGSFNCNKINTTDYTDNFYWYGANFLCFRVQSVYRTILAIIMFLFGKLTLFLWAFSDILSIALCQALKYLLLAFKHDIEQMYLQGTYTNGIEKQSWWDQIRQKYFHIVDLFDQMTNFIYPLILSCYWINIYLVIENVYFYLFIINICKIFAINNCFIFYISFLTGLPQIEVFAAIKPGTITLHL